MYKEKQDFIRRQVHFKVGCLVLAHMRKKTFPKGEYNKVKLKNIGSYRILRKFLANAYEIKLTPNICWNIYQ